MQLKVLYRAGMQLQKNTIKKIKQKINKQNAASLCLLYVSKCSEGSLEQVNCLLFTRGWYEPPFFMFFCLFYIRGSQWRERRRRETCENVVWLKTKHAAS